ncbi:MAG: hypothetical protein HC769_14845 [Cyanobacteria bacterium CRU_2_1]|nr:hypothetical protein [Cyanobacteria bacterium RU_5_0]NJR59999.1 hypothetical protein [Cyanobacteria bacterium CRU_2_1]
MKEDSQIWYVSAIALKFIDTLPYHPPIWDTAKQLADYLKDDLMSASPATESRLDRVQREFTVQAVPPGWIHLYLSDRGLTAWLQVLTNQLSTLQLSTVGDCNQTNTCILNNSNRNSTSIANVLYTHAHCCSLLRLGLSDQLIHLSQRDAQLPTSLFVNAPQPIPWSTCDHALRCNHPTERRLIVQIVTILDCLSDPSKPISPSRIIELADILSHNFQSFYAACRIWGVVKASDRALAQARLGLVWVTQAMLRLLLQNGLGITAPIEL